MTVIRVENLSKQYRLGLIGGGTLRADLSRWWAMKRGKEDPLAKIGESQDKAKLGERFWALKDVSFEVKQGEVLGIIGRNGAGKSTLLKILSRVTSPTEGTVKMKGRVGSLLEVGTGFHGELTGRENTYLNGAILGMTRREVTRKLDEIIAFAEMDKFIDTPVKRYSSGMYVRLAFAVAAHLDPEILIVDEVLAVGDAAFQKKCLGKMGEVSREGRTVLFVSHNMVSVLNLTTDVIMIETGRLSCRGNPDSVVSHYSRVVRQQRGTADELGQRTDRTGSGIIRLCSVRWFDPIRGPGSLIRSGGSMVVELGYDCPHGPVEGSVDIGISMAKADEQLLFVLYASYEGTVFRQLPEHGVFRVRVPALPLAANDYVLGTRVTHNGQEADWVRGGLGTITVAGGDFYQTGHAGYGSGAPVLVRGEWAVDATREPYGANGSCPQPRGER